MNKTSYICRRIIQTLLVLFCSISIFPAKAEDNIRLEYDPSLEVSYLYSGQYEDLTFEFSSTVDLGAEFHVSKYDAIWDDDSNELLEAFIFDAGNTDFSFTGTDMKVSSATADRFSNWQFLFNEQDGRSAVEFAASDNSISYKQTGNVLYVAKATDGVIEEETEEKPVLILASSDAMNPDKLTRVSVKKIWNGPVGKDNLSVTLKRNGTVVSNAVLNEANRWTYVFEVPYVDGASYTIEEETVEGFTSNSPLTVTNAFTHFSSLDSSIAYSAGYPMKKQANGSYGIVPIGDYYLAVDKLNASDPNNSYTTSANIKHANNFQVYKTDGSVHKTFAGGFYYEGPLTSGYNYLNESFTIRYNDAFTDASGAYYDAVFNFTNPVIYARTNYSSRKIMFIRDDAGFDLNSLSNISDGRFYGGHIDTEIRLYDKQGNPATGKFQLSFTDIDIPDLIYEQEHSGQSGYGDKPWQEAVEPLSGVSSAIYVFNDTTIRTSDNRRFYGSENIGAGNRYTDVNYAGILYTADAQSTSFRIYGASEMGNGVAFNQTINQVEELVNTYQNSVVKRMLFKKTWSKAIGNPVTIRVEGSDGSVRNYELNEANNWMQIVDLPAYLSDGTTEITYKYVEEAVSGFTSSVTALTNVKSVSTSYPYRYTYSHDRGYDVLKTNFKDTPLGDYQIDNTKMLLPTAEKTITGNLVYHANKQGVGDGGVASTTLGPTIFYQGALNAGQNIVDGSAVIKYNDIATDALGNKYDIRMSFNNIVIYSPSAKTNGQVGLIRNDGHIFSYSVSNEGVYYAVTMDITTEVLDKDGNPAPGNVQYTFNDIDAPDWYHGHSASSYGTADSPLEFVESIEPMLGVTSPIYLGSSTTVKTKDNKKFYATQTDATNTSAKSRVVFTAKAAKSVFKWYGSMCATAIAFNGYPTNFSFDTISNNVTNTANPVKKAILKKFWYTSDSAGLPSEITVKVKSSKNDIYTYTLKKSEDWIKFIELPAKSGSTNLTYTYWEEPVDGFDTASSEASPLTLSVVDTYKAGSGVYNYDSGYDFQKTGLTTVPLGEYDYIGTGNIGDSNTTVTLNNSNLRIGSGTVSDNNAGLLDNTSGVYYSGALAAGDNMLEGGYTIFAKDMFKDALDRYYDCRISVSNININSVDAIADGNIWLAYNASGGSQSGTGMIEFGVFWKDGARGNVLRMSQDVRVEILDKRGNPAPYNVQMMFSDIDRPHMNSTSSSSWDGIYVESIEPLNGVSSAVYAASNTYVETDDNKKFRASHDTDASAQTRSTIAYTVRAADSAFRIKGSMCGTVMNFAQIPSGVVLSDYLNTIVNAENTPVYKRFSINKTWTKDIVSNRPDSINVHIIGSDGSDKVVAITKENSWSAVIDVPAYKADGTTEITYSVYEEAVANYNSNSSNSNRLSVGDSIKFIKPSDYAFEAEQGYLISNTGLDVVPMGDYEQNDLTDEQLIANTTVELGENFTYEPGKVNIYTYSDTQSQTYGSISWKGNLTANQINNLGGYKVRVADFLKNKDGSLYDIELEVSDITVKPRANKTNAGFVLFALTCSGMQASGDLQEGRLALLSHWTKTNQGFVGVSQTVTLRVLDKAGRVASGNVQISFADLDITDRYAAQTGDSSNHYKYEYSEGIRPVSGLTSKLYTESNTFLLLQADGKIRGTRKTNSKEEILRSTVVYTGAATESKFVWYGATAVTYLDVALFPENSLFANLPSVALTNTYNLQNEEVQKIVLKKNWKNDDAANRPSSVNVHLVGSDGSNRNAVIDKAHNWTVEFKDLPVKSGSTNINYTVYEDNVTGYASDATDASRKAVGGFKYFKAAESDYAYDDGYFVMNSGFSEMPIPDYLALNGLNLNTATLESGNNFTLLTGQNLYPAGNLGTNMSVLSWNGNLNSGVNIISDTATVKFTDAFKDIYGNKYDAKVTVSGINLYSSADLTNKKAVLLCGKAGENILWMKSGFVGENPGQISTKFDVELKLYDKNGNPASGNVQFVFKDIDSVGVNTHSYDDSYAESIEPLSGVRSYIYTSPASVLTINNNTRFVGSRETSSEAEILTSTIAYLGNIQTHKYRWAASDGAATAINLNEYPIGFTFNAGVNSINNTFQPALYKRIFVQKNWVNDSLRYRPTSVTAHLIGSDGSNREVVLKASNNWKEYISVPAKTSGGADITYQLYEDDISDYKPSNPASNKLTVSSSVSYYEYGEGTISQSNLSTNSSGFTYAPIGDYIPVSYSLHSFSDDTQFTLPDGYVRAVHPSCANQCNPDADGIYYTKPVSAGVNNLPGPIKIKVPSAYKDFYGNEYDIVWTISDMQVVMRQAASNRKISLIGKEGTSKGGFSLHAYWGDRVDADFIKFKAKVTLQLFDKNGAAATGDIQMSFGDLDVPDANGLEYTDYYGEYSESIEPLENITSAIFVTGDTLIRTEDNKRYHGSDWSDNSNWLQSTMVYSAKTNGSSFIWRGTNCGTVIDTAKFPSNLFSNTTTISNELIAKTKAQVIYRDLDTNTELERSPLMEDVLGHTIDYSTGTTISKYTNLHYVLENDGFTPGSVYPDEGTSYFYVDFRHGKENVSGSENVKRTIDYVFEDGHTPLPGERVVQNGDFSRTGVKDLVTDTITWYEWVPENKTFNEVVSPSVIGYLPDISKVEATTVAAEDEDINITVTYKPIEYAIRFDPNRPLGYYGHGFTLPQEGLKYDVNYHLNKNGYTTVDWVWTNWNFNKDGSGRTFTDEEEFINLTSNNGETIVLYAQWRPLMKAVVIYRDVTDNIDLFTSEVMIGEPNSEIIYSPNEKIEEFEDIHYVLYNNPFEEKQYYNNTPTPTTKEIIVEFVHDAGPDIREKKVSNTVHYVYEDGSKAFDDHVENANFVLNGVRDYARSITTWWNWHAEGSEEDSYKFAAIDSPSLTGYKSSKNKSDEHVVSHESNNLEETIVYSPISYEIVFDANRPVGTTGEGGDEYGQGPLKYDETYSLRANEFTTQDYKWIEWMDKPNNPTKTWTDEEEFKNLTSEDGGKITLYANWVKYLADYNVEYYYQDKGVYHDVPDYMTTRHDQIGKLAKALESDLVSNKERFVFDEKANNVLEAVIKEDDSTTLKIYFKKQFIVKFLPDEYSDFEETPYPDLDYDTPTPDSPDELCKVGYYFDGWDKEIEPVVTQDMIYIARCLPMEVDYKVRVFYQQDGEYDDGEIIDTRKGKTDDTVKANEKDKTPDETHTSIGKYVLDENAPYKYEDIVKGDGSTELLIYFKPQFTVTYSKGEHGTFDDFVTEDLTYGDETPEFTDTTGEEGYIFTGWDKPVEETVTEDIEYIAQWEPDNVNYVVEFYYEKNGKYDTIPDKTDLRKGSTDSTISIREEDKVPEIEKFVLDEKMNSNWTVKINGNGSSVLKVYFKRPYSVVYDPGQYGPFKLEKHENIPYGTPTPKEPNTERKGYVFLGWNSEGGKTEETVIKDLYYISLYRPISYSIVYHPNGGKGKMDEQVIPYDVKDNIHKNGFESDCKFVEWNTKHDGSGTKYEEGKEVINLSEKDKDIINLYAIWSCPVVYREPETGINY